MSFILALDEGTTSARAVLFDDQGTIRAIAQRELRQSFPRTGWVEHDPHEIWEAQIGVVEQVLDQTGTMPREIAALGITNQRETTVVWNRKTGEPIYPAIVWQDRRTAPTCDRLRAEGCESWIQQRTGLLLDAYFSATKLVWILDHVPDARREAEAGNLAFGTVDTWLVWKLTSGNRHITDASNASRTMLFNIHECRWDQEILQLLGIPSQVLPEVRSSSEVYDEGWEGVPIAGIAGDQQAALFGQMCISPGLTKNTYGTGCFMLQHTGATPVASRHKLLTTIAWKIGTQLEYALEGSVFVGGAVVQWLRDGLKLIESSADVEALAASVPDHGGVFLVPAFAGLGAPHWDSYARGTVVGLSRETTAGHIARAALESIAFQVADLHEAMQIDAGLPLKELRVDGGAARNNLLLQFQADLLGVPVVRPAVIESTALGAAYLAGLAVGLWKSAEEISRHWQVERRFNPQMPVAEARQRRERWHDALERAKGWERKQTP